jgi:hypothetical protein
VRFELVDSPAHKLGEFLRVGDYFGPQGFCKTLYAVVATDKNKVVGFWKFTLPPVTPMNPGTEALGNGNQDLLSPVSPGHGYQ